MLNANRLAERCDMSSLFNTLHTVRYPIHTSRPSEGQRTSQPVFDTQSNLSLIPVFNTETNHSRYPYHTNHTLVDPRLSSSPVSSTHTFESNCQTKTGQPVIKQEYHPSARRDWDNNRPAAYAHDEAYPPYNQLVQQQPIQVAIRIPGPQHQYQQADTDWQLRTPVTTPAMSGCCYLDYEDTNTTNGRRNHENQNQNDVVSVAQQHAPHISGILGHQNHDIIQSTQDQKLPRYYDASHHRRPAADITAFVSSQSMSSSSYPNSGEMSTSFEARTFPDYPQSALMGHHQDQQEEDIQNRYPSPPPMGESVYTAHTLDAAMGLNMEMPELSTPTKEESDAQSPGRSKPIPKPDRQVTKGDDGRFVCTWDDCREEVRTFNRKCEWSKHMDKHDRPYKCPAETCDKLPGFTYSGGLLRHQREVHNLHGGPRKQLNCPHPNCKRFSGKGFSRQENLNEHLRRVHTDAGDIQNGEETEEEGSERAGSKRKRVSGRDDGSDLRQEMARLRQENEELRRQSELQTQQTGELMRQLQNLQSLVGSRIGQGPPQAPQASMI